MQLKWGYLFMRSGLSVGIVGLLLTLVMPIAADEHNYLSFGIHPYLPEKQLIKKFLPLNQYLSEAMGVPIKIKIAKDYESHIERFGSNDLDIAYMGPASYIEMTRRYGRFPLLARLEVNGSPTFHGVIVVRRDSPIQSLQQLKNKRVAFGSVKSTMSYLVPRRMLLDTGVPLDELEEYSFLGNHRNVALGVLLGEYDAGAVKEAVYEKFASKGLRALAKSPEVSEHMFVASQKLSPIQVKKLRQALYSLARSQQGEEILKKIKNTVTGLVPVRDQDYDSLRRLLH